MALRQKRREYGAVPLNLAVNPGFAVPSNIGVANAAGVAATVVRSDHVHNHVAGLGFNLHHAHYNRMIWGVLSLGDLIAAGSSARFIYLQPIIIEYLLSIDRIGWMNGAAAGSVKVGIYQDNGDTPDGGALIVGSVAVACAGNIQKQEQTIATTQLTPGLYWLVLLPQGVTNVNCFAGDTCMGAGGTLSQYYLNIASDNLPDPCPTGLTAAGNLPILYARVASVP